MTRGLCAALLSALLSVPALADRAAAQTTCDCERDCVERRDPEAGLVFDDETHRLWYALRFWQGQCHPTLDWCFSGDDWYDLMAEVLARSAAAQRGGHCMRLWQLGRAIGHEWSRENDRRRIDTDDLEAWRDEILDAGYLPTVLDRLEALVAERLR